MNFALLLTSLALLGPGPAPAAPPAPGLYCRVAGAGALHLRTQGGQLRFALDAQHGANVGELSGTFRRQGPGVYTYAGGGCRLTLRAEAGGLRLSQAGSSNCNAGVGVGYAGLYRPCPGGPQPPKASATLRSRGVLPDAALDDALRQRTGPEVYARLVESAEQVETTDTVLAGRPVRVSGLFVPGLGGLLESVLLVDGRQVWAATIQDEQVLCFAPAGTPATAPLPAPLARWAARLGLPVVRR